MLVQLGHLKLEIRDGEVDTGTPGLELSSRRGERILQCLNTAVVLGVDVAETGCSDGGEGPESGESDTSLLG